jgi:ATP-dependent RNA helicase DeaD
LWSVLLYRIELRAAKTHQPWAELRAAKVQQQLAGGFMTFSELGLSENIVRAIEERGYTEPTEIQQQAVPLLIDNIDLIGRSNTGSGKTAAFGLPIIEKILRNPPERNVQALVLCPTRELAMQAADEFRKFAKYTQNVKILAVFGGASIENQIRDLRRGVNIVIGTPGRVIDHINRKTLRLDCVNTVVLDEADEMLSMGFKEDIEEILKSVPEERQTSLFSATMPPDIMAIINDFLHNPKIIQIKQATRTVDTIEQYYYEVSPSRKLDSLLLLLLMYEPKSAVIFCNTKKMVEEIQAFLTKKNFRACSIHGDMKQIQRTMVMNSFKSGIVTVLIATDVAARGIDVNGIDAVFNYDLPDDKEYYIHRIGRTGRAGKSGKAYTIVSSRKQIMDLQNIQKYTKATITHKAIPNRQQVKEARCERFYERLMGCIGEETHPSADKLLEKLNENGVSDSDIAKILLSKQIIKLTKDVPKLPEVSPEPYKKFNKDGGMLPDMKSEPFKKLGGVIRKNHNEKRHGSYAKVTVSLGRINRVAPRFILAAFTERTGIPGKLFGKIDIFDKFSTIEVPADSVDTVISTMNGGKINNQTVTVRAYR